MARQHLWEAGFCGEVLMAHAETTPCVLVGYDGTWRTEAVLDAAAEDARRRRRALAVVTVVQGAEDPRLRFGARAAEQEAAQAEARGCLERAAAHVRRSRPGVAVTGVAVPDVDAPAMAALLPPADRLVVGARGRHDQPGFALGSVSRRLLQAAGCPVLVVPDDSHPDARREDRPVVAGVDDDPAAPLVVHAAADEAHARGTHLLVVHAFRRRPGEDGQAALQRAQTGVESVLDHAALGPGSPVTVVVTPGEPAAALLLHAERASMVVMGSRGPLALAGLALGSVSRAVLDATPCPVLVVAGEPAVVPPQRARDREAAPQTSRTAPGRASSRGPA
jgi:nucleotide-binding universal stress UspA family protein